ncbi:N-acetylglucosamine kinase [Pseudonocardia alaniniphila]|uniref:ATPase n=1 Tax=Pseudonocardia alaniniphila TaxID=75291 RepID=A0ABS9TN85_9PSEU|nr:BadF/BadG/BcrA/BcrD ATPase family protein [Pseudonocardia alaniniphila]MCH6169731.1 ATPase [Pseudonocardia alaniniphila]
MELFLGMDVGGSRSRAAVVDGSGRLLGAAEGPGGNPVSHPPDQAFRALAGALRAVLHDLPAGDVRSAVLGMAGVGPMQLPAMAADLADLAHAVGLPCRPAVVGDVIVAFAAGTAEPDGTVLIAGTGATAARITGRERTAGTDGHGWLVGDTGSAFWLGQRAVRAALAALDGRGAATSLVGGVVEALLGTGTGDPVPATALDADAPADTAERIVHAVHAGPPIALARLAPLVSVAARAGDAVAGGIVAEAASALVADVEPIRDPGERTPIVMAGSVVAGDTPVAELTRARLAARWPGCVVTAGDAARAAAWLAAARSVPPGRAAELHAAILGT